jgi:hypothetical protein
MDAHAQTIKTVRDGPVCTLILRGDLDFPETGSFLEQAALAADGGPLTEWLFSDPAIETGDGCTGLIFSARDDSDLYGLLDRIQDLGLHLISLCEVGGTEAVPHLPLRATLAHPGASPLDDRGTP